MRIALALGDAGGVGPELAAKLLAHDDMKALDVIVVGDARVLIDAGFRLETVTPVDQFLWSSHVELVGVFKR